MLPNDEVYGDPRAAIEWAHEGSRSDWLTYSARVQRVSDQSYWKDFPGQMPALTQRLMPSDLSGTRRFLLGNTGEVDTYARAQLFQTLQDPNETDSSSQIQVPYQRSPQLGVARQPHLPGQRAPGVRGGSQPLRPVDRRQENNYIGKVNTAITARTRANGRVGPGGRRRPRRAAPGST